MIHKTCMPVYKWSRFFLRTTKQAIGSTRGSTRGPSRPKKNNIINQDQYQNLCDKDILQVQAKLVNSSWAQKPASLIEDRGGRYGDIVFYIRRWRKRRQRSNLPKIIVPFYSLHYWRECFKRAIVMIKVAVHTIHSTSTSFSQLISRGRSQFFFVAAGFVHLIRLPSSWSISWKTSVWSLSTS